MSETGFRPHRQFSPALGIWGIIDATGRAVYERNGMVWTQEGDGNSAVGPRGAGVHSLLTIRCRHGGEAQLKYPAFSGDFAARREQELLYAAYVGVWMAREAAGIRMEFDCRCGLDTPANERRAERE